MLEQPGCLHANMDLFRYACALFPWAPSSLLADALEVALLARTVDMRASPYDLSGVRGAVDEGGGGGCGGGASCGGGGHALDDLSPIRIETAEGRRLYQQLQVEVMRRAAPVRRRLIDAHDAVLAES